jgi:uncharacterized membrane protein
VPSFRLLFYPVKNKVAFILTGRIKSCASAAFSLAGQNKSYFICHRSK